MDELKKWMEEREEVATSDSLRVPGDGPRTKLKESAMHIIAMLMRFLEKPWRF